MNLRIRNRLIITILSLSLIPVIFIGLFISIHIRFSWIDQTIQHGQERTLRIKNQTEYYINGMVNEIKLLVGVRGITGISTGEQKSIFSELLYYSGNYEELTLINTAGDEIVKVNRTKIINPESLVNSFNSEAFEYVRKNGSTYFGHIYFSPDTGEPLMSTAVPVFAARTGELQYVFSAVIRMKKVWNLFTEIAVADGEIIYLIDESGTVIAHPNPSVVLRKTKIDFDPRETLRTGLQGGKVISATSELSLPPHIYQVITEQDMAISFEIIRTETMIIILTIIVAMVSTIITIFPVVSNIVKPIKNLLKNQDKIRNGDYSARANVKNRDELGLLAESFNRMSRTIEITQSKLKDEIQVRKESEQKFRYLSDNIEEVFWIGSIDWQKIYYISPAFEKVWGLSCSALYEKPQLWLEMVLPEYLAPIEKIISNAEKNGAEQIRFPEYQIKAADGSMKWIYARAYIVESEDSDVKIITGIAENITTRKNNELELIKANKAKGDFLANISHEMRTPLNGILGLSNLLSNTEMSSEQHELLSMISESGRNMQSIIEDLLDFAKIDAGKLLIKSELFNLHKLLLTTVNSIRYLADLKKLEIDTEFTGDNESYYGDKTRIAQIIINLLTNAIKYTEAGSIKVSCSLNNKFQLIVSDTGIGIPEDKMSSIFKSFSQIENTYTKTQKGMGLGLAITSQIVELMNGEISLTSKPGSGSSFKVVLPVSAQVKQLRPMASNISSLDEIQAAFKDRNIKVLIAEDEPINRLYLSTLLKQYGIKSDGATTGKMAVEMASSVGYDLILMDIGMPVMNGKEACIEIRKSEAGKRVPIIAITAHAYETDKTEFIDAGMDQVITKPVDEKKLLNVIIKLLQV